MAETIRVIGLKEVRAAFRKLEDAPAREFPKALRRVAEPVKQTTANLLGPYSPRTAAGVRTRIRQTTTATVEQSLRKTTGQHPNYGGLQMRHGFLPALHQHEDDIMRGIEDMLDDMIRRAGF